VIRAFRRLLILIAFTVIGSGFAKIGVLLASSMVRMPPECGATIRGSSALLVQQGFTAESKESIELGLRTAMVAARVSQIINSAASEGAENHGLRK